MFPTVKLLAAATLTASRNTCYGMIGLGAMGSPMLHNLTNKALLENKTASRIIAYDSNPKALTAWSEALVGTGKAQKDQLVIASSPAEVSELAGTVITMLPSSPHVREVYTDPSRGILAGLAAIDKKAVADSLFIDCTTCEQAVAIEVSEQVRGVGASMLDCPVSGGTVGAREATLSFMCGGSEEAFNRAKPTLELLEINTETHEQGSAAKIANNLLLGISMIGTAEAMLLGTRLGLEPSLLASILNSSTGKCWSSEVNNPMAGSLEKTTPADREYAPGFQAKLMAKDLRLALAAADLSKTKLMAGKLTSETYDQLEKLENYSNKDFSVVFRYLEEQSA